MYPFGALVGILSYGAEIADGNIEFYEILRGKPVGIPPSRGVLFEDFKLFPPLGKAAVGEITDSLEEIRLKYLRTKLPGFRLHCPGHVENGFISRGFPLVDSRGVEGGEKAENHQRSLQRGSFQHVLRKPQGSVTLVPFGRAGVEKCFHLPHSFLPSFFDIDLPQLLEGEYPILFPVRERSLSALPEHPAPGLKPFHGIVQSLPGTVAKLLQNLSGLFVYGEIPVVGHGLGGNGGGVILPDIPDLMASVGGIALPLVSIRKVGVSIQQYIDGRD
jgi:hypothetical protein